MHRDTVRRVVSRRTKAAGRPASGLLMGWRLRGQPDFRALLLLSNTRERSWSEATSALGHPEVEPLRSGFLAGLPDTPDEAAPGSIPSGLPDTLEEAVRAALLPPPPS